MVSMVAGPRLRTVRSLPRPRLARPSLWAGCCRCGGLNVDLRISIIDVMTSILDTFECTSTIRLTTKEYAYVEQIPGMRMWWEDCTVPADHHVRDCRRDRGYHETVCTAPKNKLEVGCRLALGHDGEHGALAGTVAEDSDFDAFIFWQTGKAGARTIKQPGCCPHYNEATGACCALFKDHPGACDIV